MRLLFLACTALLVATNVAILALFSLPPRAVPVVPFRASAPELHPLTELLYIDQSQTIWL